MEPAFREFAKTAFKTLIIENGKAALHGGLGINLGLDDQLGITDEEFDRMEKELEVNADKLAAEMIAELEARGLRTPDDLLSRSDEVKRVSDSYVDRLVKSVK